MSKFLEIFRIFQNFWNYLEIFRIFQNFFEYFRMEIPKIPTRCKACINQSKQTLKRNTTFQKTSKEH